LTEICSVAAKYKCCGVAVVLCCGRKEAGMRVRGEVREGKGKVKAKVKSLGSKTHGEACSPSMATPFLRYITLKNNG
jgi:hypothetical protein